VIDTRVIAREQPTGRGRQKQDETAGDDAHSASG
jgi:hypothetical protein